MPEIVIREMPEDMSYDVIWDVLHKAHEDNIRRGIVFRTMTYTPDGLKTLVREEHHGKTFVAMDGDQVVGTTTCWPEERHRWYHNGPNLKWMLLGILPSHRGKHITSMLYQAVEKEARDTGLPVIIFDTAENNTRMIQTAEHLGFRKVDFRVFKVDHYSVVFAKWLGECPFSNTVCKLQYTLRRLVLILRFKPGRVSRFSWKRGERGKNP